MTQLDAVACLVDSSPGPGFVTDLPTLTVSHIAYPARSRAGNPGARRGDTLTAPRTWKNEFR